MSWLERATSAELLNHRLPTQNRGEERQGGDASLVDWVVSVDTLGLLSTHKHSIPSVSNAADIKHTPFSRC